ncbi:MAG: hypothetical protein HQL37_07260 [Alphaproteobacteria bacterium]|nr:hypothetical protein [Alphaproteobacteria bacterium]
MAMMVLARPVLANEGAAHGAEHGAAHGAEHGAAHGAAHGASDKGFDEESTEPAMVKLEPMLAPVQGSGFPQYMPVTPFVAIRHGNEFTKLCELAPRVRDAFITVLTAHPVPLGQRGPDLDAADQDITKAIQAAVEGQMVTGTKLVMGSVTNENAVQYLPLNTRFTDCAKHKKNNKVDKSKSGGVYKPDKPKEGKKGDEKKKENKPKKKKTE